MAGRELPGRGQLWGGGHQCRRSGLWLPSLPAQRGAGGGGGGGRIHRLLRGGEGGRHRGPHRPGAPLGERGGPVGRHHRHPGPHRRRPRPLPLVPSPGCPGLFGHNRRRGPFRRRHPHRRPPVRRHRHRPGPQRPESVRHRLLVPSCRRLIPERIFLPISLPCGTIPYSAGMMELADVRDSKSTSPFPVEGVKNPLF